MVTLVNRAKAATATTGTGTITLGAAESGYQSFTDAGVVNSDVVRYTIEDGDAWEIGSGTYSTGTLTRVLDESSTGSLLNLSGDAVVYVTAAGEDIQQPPSEGPFVDGDKTKLDGIEAGATADQTAGEIKTAYESNANTNAFTDAEQTKLAGIEATADVTDAGNVNPLVDAHLNTSSATTGEYLSWTGSDYDWVSGAETYVKKTANYTAVAGEKIIADTSGGVWTLTLPASPSSGDVIKIADGADWSANNLTVGRNGSTIEGDAADMTMDIGGASVSFVYDGTTWQIYAQVGAAGEVVTLTGTQTLSNKTLTKPTLDGTITEEVYAISGTSVALEPDNGSVQTHTLTGNTTYTDGFSAGEAITVMIDDGTAYTVTWPTTTWVNNGGIAPTLATTGYTVVSLWKVGSTLYGALVGDGS